uniref:NADH dehydrogenase [ubiquinone] 1 alpha subcomplex subunit 12 n=1 Tax=Homalodisca liturata TaxID=320908 RepID=A0A1B6JJ22_9HEMI
MPKERDLVAWIFKNFINSMKFRKFTGDLKGTDRFGNKYYEIEAGGNRNKNSRYFVPVTKEDGFDQEKPAEWESWLRGRRREPPTEEEIASNYKLMMEKKRLAEEIDEKYKGPKETRPKEPLAVRGRGSFPVYPEYESVPGHKANPTSEK